MITSEFMEQSETDETHGKIFQQGCVFVWMWKFGSVHMGVLVCALVCGCMVGHQMKPIYILDMPVFIRELSTSLCPADSIGL